MDYRILGPLEVLAPDGPVPLGGAKQRALLAMLLLRANEVVSTDRLIDALWGENPPKTAMTSLQNFVSQLRKTLGSDVLETKPPGYRVRVRAGELDLERFHLTVEAARLLDPPERAAKLREALGWWRGPPLADFSFEFLLCDQRRDRIEDDNIERIRTDEGLDNSQGFFARAGLRDE